MSSTVSSHTSMALDNQQEKGRNTHNTPLLLPLIGQVADESLGRSCPVEVVAQLTELAAQRLPLVAVPPLCFMQPGEERPFADQIFTTVSACLREGFRHLLLVPWGGRQDMGPLVESTRLALSAMNGEPVSQTGLAVPPVHVAGISARSALGGLSSIHTQLSPLLEAFPGWDRSWVRLSAGKTTILLLRSGQMAEQPSPAVAAWERLAVKSLAAALYEQQAQSMMASDHTRWQRDGEIYVRYLISLLSVAADFLQQEQDHAENK